MAVGCNPCLCPSQVTWPLFNSLQGFWPGMQLLVGEREMALDTMRAFHALWRHLGFHPEGFNLASMQVQPGQLGYPLRPEHVESLFWAHRTTHGGEWLRAGRDVLRSLQTLRVPCGVVCLSDVGNRTREDNMESFFLSETTKYLYLLFDPDDEVYEHGKYVFTTEAHILPLDLYNLTGDQEAVEGEAAEVAEALRQLGSGYDDDEETNEEQEGQGGGEGGEGQEEEEEGAREGGQPANGAAAAAGGGAARLALHGGCAMPSYKHLLGFYGNAPHGSNSQVEIEEALKGQQRQQQQQQQEGQQQGQQPQAAGGAAAGGAAAPAQEASRDPSAELAVRRGALLGLSHRTVQQPAAQTGRGAAGVALDEAIHQLEEAGRRPGGAASAEVEQRQRRVAQEQRRVDEEMGDEEMGDEETVAEQAQCHPLDTGCGGSMVQEEHAESMAALELAPLWEEALRLGLTDETSLGSMRGHMARGRWSARHYVGMWRRRIAAHAHDAHPATPRAPPTPLPDAAPSVARLLPNRAGLPNAARLPPGGSGDQGAVAAKAVALAAVEEAEMVEAGSRPRRCTASTSKSCCQGGLMRAGSSAPCVTRWRSATHAPHQQPQPQPEPQGRRVARPTSRHRRRRRCRRRQGRHRRLQPTPCSQPPWLTWL